MEALKVLTEYHKLICHLASFLQKNIVKLYIPKVFLLVSYPAIFQYFVTSKVIIAHSSFWENYVTCRKNITSQ